MDKLFKKLKLINVGNYCHDMSILVSFYLFILIIGNALLSHTYVLKYPSIFISHTYLFTYAHTKEKKLIKIKNNNNNKIRVYTLYSYMST